MAVEGLSPADFYDMRYKQAFEMVSDMVRKGKPVDHINFF
ncbi:DnaB-like helicase N-terminal domain-containing protein [Acetomicrobium sp. S15 = DSM 107314]